MRYYLTPVRMAGIKKTRNKKCWWGCEEKGTLVHCWWEWKLIQAVWQTVWSFFKKLKIEIPYDLVIPLLCGFKKIYIPLCLLQHYLQWPRYGSNLRVHQYMNKEDAVYVYVHAHIHIHVCRCICICMYTYIYIAHMYVYYIYTFVYLHVYMYVYTCVCACTHIYRYTYTNTRMHISRFLGLVTPRKTRPGRPFR